MREIRIYSLMRSGHHAVANWIYRQLPDSTAYANHVNSGIWNPSPNDNRIREVFDLFQQNKLLSNDLVEVKMDKYRLKMYPVFKKKKCISIKNWIYAIEDDACATFANGKILVKDPLCYDLSEIHHSFGFGKSNPTNVLVIRDPYNWMASRMAYKSSLDLLDRAIEFWQLHALEYLENNKLSNPVFVNYNEWVSSIEYRKSLADKLGLRFTDDGHDQMSVYGGGSSFGDFNVLKRYERFWRDRSYLNIFDKKTKKLAWEIFGIKPLGAIPLF